MNTIKEILEVKAMKEKNSLYEIYTKELCQICENKNNDKDLCEIRKTIDNTYKCFNYEKCMKNKCNVCKNNKKCFKELEEQKYEKSNVEKIKTSC